MAHKICVTIITFFAVRSSMVPGNHEPVPLGVKLQTAAQFPKLPR
jgi:hypothetical protein